MKYEVVLGGGRGKHVASPDSELAVDGRPFRTRTGEEATKKTPYLCAQCALIAFGIRRP